MGLCRCRYIDDERGDRGTTIELILQRPRRRVQPRYIGEVEKRYMNDEPINDDILETS
jgi:hypothetical protein